MRNEKLTSNTNFLALIHKMFLNDYKLTKIPKIIKDKDQLAEVKEKLDSYYMRIKNMFLVLSCDSSYPNLTSNDYLIFTQKCDFLNKDHVVQANLDNDRIGACNKTDASKKLECAKDHIMRFAFLEIIVRLA